MGTLATRTCANCGKRFMTRDRNKIYCDLRCEEYAKDGISLEYKEKIEPERPSKQCLFCGKTFYQKKYESDKLFNSKKCCCCSCGQKYRIQREKANR